MDKLSNLDRSQVLVQAIPYIKGFFGKTIVIKYGGNAMVNDDIKKAVMTDIVLLSLIGINVVLVHGGGPEIDIMLEKAGKESVFIDGLRQTDAETMDIVQMVLAGKVNKELVQMIETEGGKSIGLCGLDGSMIKAKSHTNKKLGFVGEISEINVQPLRDIMEKGYIPVVATIASGRKNRVYNINADTAAAQIAAELDAEKLILMTDIRGLLRDKNDDSTLIHSINVSEVAALKKQGIIADGMIPKVDCCVEAVRRGVTRAHIIDGRIPHCILLEVFTNRGIGTMILKDLVPYHESEQL